MYIVRCQPNCSALFLGLGPRLRIEQLVRFDPQHPRDPHDCVESRVRLAAFDVADERPTSSGSIGEMGLGQPQREPQLADVAAQRSSDAPLYFFKGFESCQGPSANPSRPAHSGGGRRSGKLFATSGRQRLPRCVGIQGLAVGLRRRAAGLLRAEVDSQPYGRGGSTPLGPQELAFVPESLNLAAVKG